MTVVTAKQSFLRNLSSLNLSGIAIVKRKNWSNTVWKQITMLVGIRVNLIGKSGRFLRRSKKL